MAFGYVPIGVLLRCAERPFAIAIAKKIEKPSFDPLTAWSTATRNSERDSAIANHVTERLDLSITAQIS